MQERHITQLVEDSQFFAKCSQELRQIATNSKFEQEKLRRVKKIVAVQEKSKRQPQHIARKLVDNIVIDYLRANKLNFTYSVMMRERNLVSDQIMGKMSLVQQFGLKDWFDKEEGYDVSVVELLLAKLADVGERKKTVDMGVQIELLNKDNTVNNMIINELRLSEVRREVQERQKKHYQKMLNTLKQQLSVTIKDQLKKQHDNRVKDIKNEYQRQVGMLKEKNKEYLVNNPKLNPKIQQYLSKIEQLQTKNMNLTLANRQLEQDKITHNCYNNSKIVERQAELKKEKDYVERKKRQYQLALKNLHTSVQDLVAQKEKLHEQPKQTDLFINELKKNKKNKDYMIEEIYGRMAVMEKRIEGLSKDNDNLREQNRQLLGKVKQLEKEKQSWREKVKEIKPEKQAKTIMPKPKTKDVILGVSESAIRQQIDPPKQHVIDEQQASIENSQQSELFYETKQNHKLEIQKVQAEMRTIKNKLRLLVTQFD